MAQVFWAWPSLLFLLFKFIVVSITSSIYPEVNFVVEAGTVLFVCLFVVSFVIVVSFIASAVVVSLFVSLDVVSFIVLKGTFFFFSVYLKPLIFLVGLVFYFSLVVEMMSSLVFCCFSLGGLLRAGFH